MAQIGEGKASPFHVEALILAYEESETSEKRLKARLLKDVKIQEKDSSKPLVTRPVWPYETWRANYDLDSTWEVINPQTHHNVPLGATSANHTLQNTDLDHFNCPDTKMNALNPVTCEIHTTKKSTPHPSLSEDTSDTMQRTINLLNDLQNLLSVGFKIFNDIRAESDATTITKGHDQTQGKLPEISDMSKPEVMEGLEQSNPKGPEGKAEFPVMTPSNTFDFNLNSNRTFVKGSEMFYSPTELSNKESREIAKDITLKNTLLGVKKCEELLTTEDSETRQISDGGNAKNVYGLFDCKEGTCSNVRMGSVETLETKFDLKGTGGAIDSRESQVINDESEQDIGDRCLNKTLIQSKEINTSKRPHCKSELQFPVSQKSVLYNFIQKWLPRISIDETTSQNIRQLVRRLMDSTILELQGACSIFSKCYIVETGSMAEGTKIGAPDEFDVTVALPMLANSDVAELLYVKLGIQTRLHKHMSDEVLSFLQQFSFVDASYGKLLTNAYLLQVFRDTLRKYLPVGWAMLEESDMHMMRVFLKNQTLTVHLQCTSGPYSGFNLSIDVCFGIPLEAERLQSVLVGDVTHAVHLSYIQSECMRMKTRVIAVVSRNPLVGERFFYETEPSRFHSNKLAADCYKLAKHVARMFLPKLTKNSCVFCEETLIPSFYMKTAVSFMMDVYTEESDWSSIQLGNRLIEIFEILSHCLQSQSLAYYSYINSLKPDSKMKYSPANSSLKVTIGLDNDKPCIIPRLEDFDIAPSRDMTTAVESYLRYMKCEEWTVCDLLHKLTELLYAFKFAE